MYILLYKGRTITSVGIKFQTRSKYSHAAIMLSDGTVYESVSSGVQKVNHPWENHSKKTGIDFFEVKGDYDEAKLREWLDSQVGKKYDFSAIFRFISRRNEPKDDRWFCSELVLAALAEVGVYLLNKSFPPSHGSPRDLSISPLILMFASFKAKKDYNMELI